MRNCEPSWLYLQEYLILITEMVEQSSRPLDSYAKATGRNVRTFKAAMYSSLRSSNIFYSWIA